MSRGRAPRRDGPQRARSPLSSDDASSRAVYGLHPVRELLRAGNQIRGIQLAATRTASPVVDEIRSLAEERRVPVEIVDRDHLDDLLGDGVHQGVLADAVPFPYSDAATVVLRAQNAQTPGFLVALDQVTDPHNLGSIARTAEALGAHGMIVPGRRAAHVTPMVEKAAAGALAHLPLARANLAQAIDRAKQAGFWVLGLAADGACSIDESQLLAEPVLLIVGSEGDGMSRLTTDSCDQLVSLPMDGHVGSLNASVAAGLAMFSVRQARHRQAATPG